MRKSHTGREYQNPKIKKKKENKEMTENEMKEFRWGLCFKVRPLPNFYHKREPIKESNQKDNTNVFSVTSVDRN
jgi:Targeting protein for Xklp2 (TPX2) domain